MNYFKYICIILLIYSSSLLAQMPGWKPVTDKDSNKYYIDGNGKIFTSGEPESEFRPVSIDSLDYFLSQGKELIKNHYKSRGLRLLKSIMMMRTKGGRIHEAQRIASEEINRMKMAEGTRFDQINRDASILMFKENDQITLINDQMKYSMKSEFPLSVISIINRENKQYYYSGILLGLRFGKDQKTKTGYDLLVAVDSDQFPVRIKNINELEDHWRKRLGSDTFSRTIIKKEKERVLYEFRDTYEPYYSGYESMAYKSNCGYYFRIISADNTFNEKKSDIKNIAGNFKIY